MGFAGFGRTEIRYDMFDIHRSAEEAKRFVKCERIYHLGQELAWDGKEILPMLIKQHGGIRISGEHKEALKRIFAIILWGELGAWKISAQLADRLVPLEAKMAATSQAMDEARHFYVMYDYLRELDYVPTRMDPAPQALLDLVLDTNNLAYKIVGMQLMIETIALAVFQAVRETGVEPVLCDLLKYYERDEARHVGLGMQYLPDLIKDMSTLDVLGLSLFQVRLMAYGLWENKLLEKDLETLQISPRMLIDRTRRKQMAAMQQAFEAVGMAFDRDDNVLSRGVGAAIEYFFPIDKNAPASVRAAAAFRMLRRGIKERFTEAEFAVHDNHVIKTARGKWVGPNARAVPPAKDAAE